MRKNKEICSVEELLATNFPNSLDNLSNPSATDSLSGHAAQHQNANDAIEAIQAKIGVDGSLDENSIDYKISDIKTQLSGLTAGTETISELLGLEGNNDVIVTGIENKTVIDSFSRSLFSTVRYVIQTKSGLNIVSEALDVVIDSTDFHVQHYEVSSNTNTALASITLEENSGIINLCVTPVTGVITARFYRTALKA